MKQPTKSHTDVLFFKFQYSRSARDALGSTAERQLGPAAHLPGIYTPALAPGILKKGTFFFFFFFPSLTDDNIIQWEREKKRCLAVTDKSLVDGQDLSRRTLRLTWPNEITAAHAQGGKDMEVKKEEPKKKKKKKISIGMAVVSIQVVVFFLLTCILQQHFLLPPTEENQNNDFFC